jgi:hypothetical protein
MSAGTACDKPFELRRLTAAHALTGRRITLSAPAAASADGLVHSLMFQNYFIVI